MSATPVKKVCPHCGSEDVSLEAVVRWNQMGQCWDISGIFEESSGRCGNAECMAEDFEPKEVEV